MSDRVPLQQLREFIFQEICEYLTPKEVQHLAYVQALPPTYLSKDGTEVFLKLEMLDRFSEANITPVAEMMRAISRKDLAKKVEKYAKKQRQNRLKNKARAIPVSDQMFKECQIEASLKIAKHQANILLEQLEEVHATAREIDYRRLEDRAAVVVDLIKGELQCQLSAAFAALNMRQTSTDSSLEDYSSPYSSLANSDDGIISPGATLDRQQRPRLHAMSKTMSLPRDFKRKGSKVTAPVESEENQYEYVSPLGVSWALQAREDESMGRMVTGCDGKTSQPKQKPPVAPKPPRKLTDSPEDQMTDYSEGTADTTTGDSGFVDSKKYRKDSSMPPKVAPHHKYTQLNAEQREEATFYADTNFLRKEHPQQDGVYDEVPFDNDRVTQSSESPQYVNFSILSRSNSN